MIGRRIGGRFGELQDFSEGCQYPSERSALIFLGKTGKNEQKKKIKKVLQKVLTNTDVCFIMILALFDSGWNENRAGTSDFKTSGVWLSLARAPGLGPGSRRFESCHPDCVRQHIKSRL